MTPGIYEVRKADFQSEVYNRYVPTIKIIQMICRVHTPPIELGPQCDQSMIESAWPQDVPIVAQDGKIWFQIELRQRELLVLHLAHNERLVLMIPCTWDLLENLFCPACTRNPPLRPLRPRETTDDKGNYITRAQAEMIGILHIPLPLRVATSSATTPGEQTLGQVQDQATTGFLNSMEASTGFSQYGTQQWTLEEFDHEVRRQTARDIIAFGFDKIIEFNNSTEQ